jgi:preprotein translocase subunit SecD
MYFSRGKVITIFVVCIMGILFALPNLFSKAELAKIPAWLPHRQINLGLDLKGGAYLLLQLDLDAMRKEQIDTTVDALRNQLRTDKIGFTTLEARGANDIHLVLRDPAQMHDAMASIAKTEGFTPAITGGDESFAVTAGADNQTIDAKLTDHALDERASKAVEQSIEIVRRRIDQLGVTEPQIAKQGNDRILVQLPGVEDPDRVKAILGTTAKMNFQLLDDTADPSTGHAPPGDEILPGDDKDPSGKPRLYVVKKKIEVSGGDLTNAQARSNSDDGKWVVTFEFNNIGARRFAQTTTDNVGKPFAIVLDNKVISAPVIREPITGGSGQISGTYTAQSANDLAVLLRAGALPAPLKIIEERSVGPDLGADSIRQGVYAAIFGLALVGFYMVGAYGLFGLFADIALVFNLIITIAVLSLIQATLTLPGIAGLLLSVGMSVDANILVNERIREESRAGRTPYAALESGFHRAFGTVLDANLTTLIKMAILFLFGAGVVKGFAVTISFGIMISLFTAMVFVRWMMVVWLRRTRPKTLFA